VNVESFVKPDAIDLMYFAGKTYPVKDGSWGQGKTHWFTY
jgi:hypothetical protein